MKCNLQLDISLNNTICADREKTENKSTSMAECIIAIWDYSDCKTKKGL